MKNIILALFLVLPSASFALQCSGGSLLAGAFQTELFEYLKIHSIESSVVDGKNIIKYQYTVYSNLGEFLRHEESDSFSPENHGELIVGETYYILSRSNDKKELRLAHVCNLTVRRDAVMLIGTLR